MNLISAIAIYFIIWWLVLFAVLPWGATSPHESGEESEQGHAQSAPTNPRLPLKFAATTVIAAVIFATFYAIVQLELVALDDLPFMPELRPYSAE